MSMIKDIYAYLADMGEGDNLFESRLPDKPTDLCAMFGYAGRSPIYVMSTHDDGTPFMLTRERPGLQIQSRAEEDEEAERRVYAITGILEMIVNQTINGTYYVRVEGISAPYQLRRDEQDRSIWAANFATEKEK